MRNILIIIDLFQLFHCKIPSLRLKIPPAMTNEHGNKRFFLTGGAGFIGSHLSQRLMDQGSAVVCIDNFNDYYDPEIKRKNAKEVESRARELGREYSCVEGDIRDREYLKSIFEKYKFDCVIHLAAMAGVRASMEKPQLYHDVNINGTARLFECIEQAGISRVVFGSSSSVYGGTKEIPFKETQKNYKTLSPYASTKRSNELFCEQYSKRTGTNIASLRFFTVYGPRQRPDMAINKFVRLALANEPIPIFGDGEMKRDYTYVGDIVSGIVASIRWLESISSKGNCEIFNLARGKMTTLNELVKCIEKALNKKIKVTNLEIPSTEMPLTYGDISKANKALGYSPEFSLEMGVANFVSWYKETFLIKYKGGT